ncbi:hypothetical protein IFM89_033971 [Coptis chinensis]|uniref:K+ potassium transporter integral membrane domain-containing protein n=1 Tax=Coptis chinensis TaxID=261450 RepID=A0A835HP73_9MAGN|nr:hypothetical protein IFM89_033971 [Coptis chinensis]
MEEEEAGRVKDLNREESLGVVYGELGTSPLYVFYNTFPYGVKDPEDIIGALSARVHTHTKHVTLVNLAKKNKGFIVPGGRLNFCPLGACARLVIGLPIDRFMTSNALGFTAPMRNRISTVIAVCPNIQPRAEPARTPSILTQDASIHGGGTAIYQRIQNGFRGKSYSLRLPKDVMGDDDLATAADGKLVYCRDRYYRALAGGQYCIWEDLVN